ncbi:MAG: site-specific DNA-methyltransferase [PVC group bacterium]|nr:site-specific DNA-methyltransferase [PVC group bacterium]
MIINSECLEAMQKMEYNIIHNMDFLNNALPAGIAKLIIADPPYYKTKGAFDFIYTTFDEYLQHVELWVKECSRLMADNGTLLWWGHARRIAYTQIIIDKFLNFENSIVWEKKDTQTLKGVFQYRSFAPVTERLLMYSKEVLKTGLQEIFDNPSLFLPIKQYMRDERDKCMDHYNHKTISDFNAYINDITDTSNVVSRHYFADSQYAFPTAAIYAKMQNTGFWQKNYEELRTNYEELRRPFNNSFGLTDVLRFSQESGTSKLYNHDTIKPLLLTRKLVEICSNPGDVVLVPFAGSGTECLAAKLTNRKYIGIEMNPEYCEIAKARIKAHHHQTELFEGEN